MKQDELIKHAKCSNCQQPIGHAGLPLFWRITVDRFGIDLRAVQRQDGLSAFLGSSRIAAAMGPDEDMAKPMMDPVTLTLCETCGLQEVTLAALAMP